ncbi:2-nitropropane dioxygenase [Piedraia hortae CBS 480.64]|uniref:2-nitropropane dioxygenase n=1 Tax=Piedraia hortae CBS 480.64 TaxID=1314780 RepID=A0A6A7BR82_9PEZI|nr:2-nitropropane dioxygenase [Piedraia hortae CBS 480.64]
MSLKTPLCPLLGITHPILLAGMAHVSTAPLAASVSNAGGLGVLGGLDYTPAQLRSMIRDLKSLLHSPTLPFGIDLALPQIGGSARKTNHDYTNNTLPELIQIIIDEGAKLFVSAVGVPPPWAVEKLHAAGVLVMNMVGHPKHALKALRGGCDLICAQGGEGGGHTGRVATAILVPAVVDCVRGCTSPLTGGPVLCVAAGGVYDGRGVAAMLAYGAAGVWVGTRFLASEEAGCSRLHKDAVLTAGLEDTGRTLVVSGRPLRVRKNEWVRGWEETGLVEGLCAQGIVPLEKDLEEGREVDVPFLMGQVAGVIHEVKPAGMIVEEMVREAVEVLRQLGGRTRGSKL